MIFGIAMDIELFKSFVPFVVYFQQRIQDILASVIFSGYGGTHLAHGIEGEFWIGRF